MANTVTSQRISSEQSQAASPSRFQWFNWSSLLLARIQSVCSAFIALHGVRLLVGIGAVVLASSTWKIAETLHANGIRIPMELIALVGALVNLIALWQVRRLRARPALRRGGKNRSRLQSGARKCCNWRCRCLPWCCCLRKLWPITNLKGRSRIDRERRDGHGAQQCQERFLTARTPFGMTWFVVVARTKWVERIRSELQLVVEWLERNKRKEIPHYEDSVRNDVAFCSGWTKWLGRIRSTK